MRTVGRPKKGLPSVAGTKISVVLHEETEAALRALQRAADVESGRFVSASEIIRHLIACAYAIEVGEAPPAAPWVCASTPPSRVYFLRKETGAIKIGRSASVDRRMRELQSSCGERLELLGTIPGGAVAEAALHKRFNHLRKFGEWFDPGEDLLGFVKGLFE